MPAALNYTTKIPVRQTISEVQEMLGQHGASSVQLHYSGGEASGVGFTLVGPHGERSFALPVDVDTMFGLLDLQKRQGKLKSGSFTLTRAQAARVAWRVVKDWLAAQLTLVDAQLAALDEVFLPYLLPEGPGTPTLYQRYREHEATLGITTGDTTT